MKKLDESAVIRIFQDKLDQRFVSEDVETFRHKTGYAVAAIDTMVESTDIPPGMKLADVSRKSVAACVSDFAAKGVNPEFGLVSISLPKRYSKKQITELAKGFQNASKEFRIRILGGDTNGGKEMSISVVLFGNTQKILKRGGAKNKDLIYVTGPCGSAAAGLQLLLKKKKTGHEQFYAKLEKAFCNPKPKLDFGIKIKKYATSAMDSSDGLAKTLNEMSIQSKKRFIIDCMPYEAKLEKFSVKNKIDIEKLVFYGGEEYEFVFTVPPQNVVNVKNIAEKQHVKLFKIGRVESGKDVLLQTGNKTKKIYNRGWSYLNRH